MISILRGRFLGKSRMGLIHLPPKFCARRGTRRAGASCGTRTGPRTSRSSPSSRSGPRRGEEPRGHAAPPSSARESRRDALRRIDELFDFQTFLDGGISIQSDEFLFFIFLVGRLRKPSTTPSPRWGPPRRSDAEDPAHTPRHLCFPSSGAQLPDVGRVPALWLRGRWTGATPGGASRRTPRTSASSGSTSSARPVHGGCKSKLQDCSLAFC